MESAGVMKLFPQCKQRIHPVLNIYYYSLTGWYWTPGDIHNPTRKVFFRPTPFGFRQVVLHARLHVAYRLIHSLKQWRYPSSKKVGCKSWTDTGPVHSPDNRHYAGGSKQRKKQTSKTTTTHKQNKNKAMWTAGQFATSVTEGRVIFFSVQRHMALARSLSKPESQLHI